MLPPKCSHQKSSPTKPTPPNCVHQNFNFLTFLIPLPHFGALSGGALWWLFPELLFFSAHFLPYSLLHPYFISSGHGGALWWWIPELNFSFWALPSLLPFAPLFHICMPQWRPLVVNSGTKFFFGALPSLLPCNENCPPPKCSHQTTSTKWRTPKWGRFFSNFIHVFLTHCRRLVGPSGGDFWEKNSLAFCYSPPPCTNIIIHHGNVTPSGGDFWNYFSQAFRSSRAPCPNISLPHGAPWRPFPLKKRPPN